jgi:hypothetical protein
MIATPQSARLQLAHEMNQLQRRFRQYEKEADWANLVMEGAATYARQAALFTVEGQELQLRAAANIDIPSSLRLTAAKAGAFDSAIRSKESVTALRTAKEVGEALANPGTLAFLFPIPNGARVVAVLFAAGDEPEVDQLELVANMAAGALERRSNTGLHTSIATPAPPLRNLAAWASFPTGERTLHSQAARYARVAVAEMQLLKPAACCAAREKGDLYVVLNKEIDKAREIYRQRFMILPSMTDYFHKEIVASILGGDATKLGADYPGELA